jgi:hypothetical protein
MVNIDTNINTWWIDTLGQSMKGVQPYNTGSSRHRFERQAYGRVVTQPDPRTFRA